MQAENTTSLRFHLNGSDKARYSPGDTVTLPCSLDITGYNGDILQLETLLFHNEVPVSKEETVLQKNEYHKKQDTIFHFSSLFISFRY